ncbi:MAG: tRNA (guanine-N7-)-methyltransferase [Ilumatobacteraceae bacterium]|jgi:tRNA (guanine-N7-)-methyltransferase
MVAYERAMTKWALSVDGPTLCFDQVFGLDVDRAGDIDGGVDGDIVLDIGFGGGEALIELAEMRPNEHVIGVDIHTPGIAAVLEAIANRALTNVRVVDGDVIDFADRVPPRSLAGIRVFFPDPWPKQRQRGRRLIRPDVVRRLVPLLRVGGSLHLATDCDDYATQMLRVCDEDAGLQGGVPGQAGGVVDRPPWRPITRFEQRGIEEGRRSVDLIYIAS